MHHILDSYVVKRAQESYQSITEFLLDEKQDYSEALKYADLLLEKVQADDKVFLTYKGRALIGLRRYEEAESVFDYLLQNHPDDSRGYYYKGEIHRKQSKMGEAKESFETAKTLSKNGNDKQGTVSALNRLVKIYLTEQNHEKVVEKAGELLNIEEDPKIRSYKGQSLIALGRTDDGFKDFKKVFREDPSDVFNARRFIEAIGLKKGYNETEKIVPLLTISNDNRFTTNIFDRFTEQSIFTDFEVVAGTLRANIGNAFVRRSIAHHLMKNTVFLYFNNQSALGKNIGGTIGLFMSFDENPSKEMLAEYWGSEKGAYLEFRADKHEGDFNKIDRIIDEIEIEKLDKATCEKIHAKIEEFQKSIKFSDDTDVECHNPHLQELLAHIETTYKAYRFNKRAEDYWTKVYAYVFKLNFDEECPLIQYTVSQIHVLASLSLNDFRTSIAHYHDIKNSLSKVIDLNKTLTQKDISDIKLDQQKKRYFLRTCRSPRFQNMPLFEIYKEVSEKSRSLGLPVKFILKDIDEDDYISVDPLRIQDCIRNLIFNAHNAMIKKDVCAEEDLIQVSFYKENGKFAISCRDSGKGMSLEEIERFKNGISNGIGVLCIIKTMQDHDGELFVESEEGVGTSIKILLKF